MSVAGRRALLSVLQKTRVIYVAARCRVSPSTVSRWASGERIPSTCHREVLASVYGIRASEWDPPPRVTRR